MYVTIQILREEINRKQGLLQRAEENKETSIQQLITETQLSNRLKTELKELVADLNELNQRAQEDMRGSDCGKAIAYASKSADQKPYQALGKTREGLGNGN